MGLQAGWIRTVGSSQWRGTEILCEVEPSPAALRSNGNVEDFTMLPHTSVATTDRTGLTPVPTGGGITRRRMVTVIRPSLRTRTLLGPFTHGAPPGLTPAITGLTGAGVLPMRDARNTECPLDECPLDPSAKAGAAVRVTIARTAAAVVDTTRLDRVMCIGVLPFATLYRPAMVKPRPSD